MPVIRTTGWRRSGFATKPSPGGKAYEHEYRLVDRDGRVRLRFSTRRAHHLRFCRRGPLRMTGVMIDITGSQAAAEESLQESEERLSQCRGDAKLK